MPQIRIYTYALLILNSLKVRRNLFVLKIVVRSVAYPLRKHNRENSSPKAENAKHALHAISLLF